ncbi:GTP-binding protein [Streptomyces sp. NPDC050504]|uniref:GTP-binding protein n=1 Tax=Streptomyces sp. NPDC050504 TaxID=3365618 RepID=UPI0037BC4C07
MHTLNLGILAHVDAGKTSLTERLLYAAGVVDEPGRVDEGSTRTDSLDQERRRGITIKSAVVSFAVDDVTVNLIDTPGHPDFIAEVERVLGVLDGAVLVVSAVEGVQAQTRVLMRTLQRLGIPTLVFVNKIDRSGARGDALLAELARKLSPAVVPMGAARDLGTRAVRAVPVDPFAERTVELLAERSDALLAAYVEGAALQQEVLHAELARQTGRAEVHPVYFGSAFTGEGVTELIGGIKELLPGAGGDPEGPLSGTVFKVERGAAGEKVAYVRMFSGALRVRDRYAFRGGAPERVTGVGVFAGGAVARRDEVRAGEIGQLRGLDAVRVGDVLGERPRGRAGSGADAGVFPPPSLETVVVPCRAADRAALHAALGRLAEQDPLIGLRHDPVRGEVSVSLYGEVQKEVVRDTLQEEFGIGVTFRQTSTICVERLVGAGAAHEPMGRDGNPFRATVGLRVEPAPPGHGVELRLGVELGSMPYAFFVAVEEAVRATLEQGLSGWAVPDCAVTVTHSGFCSITSTAGDFRALAPLVLVAALREAGTRVHEPVHRFRLEVPSGALGAVLPVLGRLRAVPATSEARGDAYVVEGTVPAASVHALEVRLPTLTSGEGVLEAAFDHYAAVAGGQHPVRARTDHNPLDRKEYLLHVLRRV